MGDRKNGKDEVRLEREQEEDAARSTPLTPAERELVRWLVREELKKLEQPPK